MKRFLISLFIIITCGCASKAPKETTQSIFSDIKNGNSKSALSTFHRNNVDTFEVYKDNHAGLRGETVRRYMSLATSFVDGCEAMVNQLKSTNVDNSKTDTQVKEIESQITVMKSNFQRECELKDNDSKIKSLNEIKSYSGVSFIDLKESFSKRFKPEALRIENEIESWHQNQLNLKAQKEAEELRKKNSPQFYEQKLCEITGILDQAKRRINQEREAAQHSGVVDKEVLYRNGQRIQAFSKQLNWVSAEYKKKFGKSWNGDCN